MANRTITTEYLRNNIEEFRNTTDTFDVVGINGETDIVLSNMLNEMSKFNFETQSVQVSMFTILTNTVRFHALDDLDQQAAATDNDFQAMNLAHKAARERRAEDAKDIIDTIASYGIDVEPWDAQRGKFIIHTGIADIGTIDFFPKKNKVLVRRTNTWESSGKKYLLDMIKKYF